MNAGASSPSEPFRKTFNASQPGLKADQPRHPLAGCLRSAIPHATALSCMDQARGFDAGIAIADWVEADMVRVPLTREIVWMVVGSPAYLALRGEPSRPEHLAKHECIRYRLPTTGAVYRWEFVRSGRTFSIDVPGSITVTEGPVTYAFARQGLGLTYAPDLAIADDLAAGRLQSVLEPFSLRTAGLYLYFPARAQSQPKLRAFIDLATSTARALGCSHRCPRCGASSRDRQSADRPLGGDSRLC